MLYILVGVYSYYRRTRRLHFHGGYVSQVSRWKASSLTLEMLTVHISDMPVNCYHTTCCFTSGDRPHLDRLISTLHLTEQDPVFRTLYSSNTLREWRMPLIIFAYGLKTSVLLASLLFHSMAATNDDDTINI
jgi:hypothetical protein